MNDCGVRSFCDRIMELLSPRQAQLLVPRCQAFVPLLFIDLILPRDAINSLELSDMSLGSPPEEIEDNTSSRNIVTARCSLCFFNYSIARSWMQTLPRALTQCGNNGPLAKLCRSKPMEFMGDLSACSDREIGHILRLQIREKTLVQTVPLFMFVTIASGFCVFCSSHGTV